MSGLHKSNLELRELMEKYNMGRRDVARLVGYPISKNGQCFAVNNWVARRDATIYRHMPDRILELLKLKLEKLTPAEKKAFEGPYDPVAVMAKNRMKRKCFQKKKVA